MNSPTVHVRLAGGLGNQLFQWAAGYALSKHTGSELVFDRTSGFKTDFKYHRNYELGALDLPGRPAVASEIIRFWAHWLGYQAGIRKFRNVRYYFEQPNVLMTSILNHPKGHSALLTGYFQSPSYYRGLDSDIRNHISPPVPEYWVYRELGERMRQENSVALGIRLYEETADPAYHAHNGQLLTVAKVQSALDRLAARTGELNIYVFCTHHAVELDQLKYPGPVKFISADEGYSDTWNGLWLLSQCRHHIFSNSSFYWWGAFLSERNYDPGSQYFLAADNFSNQAIYQPYWERF